MFIMTWRNPQKPIGFECLVLNIIRKKDHQIKSEIGDRSIDILNILILDIRKM